jgi:hypothetical protein
MGWRNLSYPWRGGLIGAGIVIVSVILLILLFLIEFPTILTLILSPLTIVLIIPILVLAMIWKIFPQCNAISFPLVSLSDSISVPAYCDLLSLSLTAIISLIIYFFIGYIIGKYVEKKMKNKSTN